MTLEVRALTDHADLREAVRLQQEIWGFAEVELLPVRLFVVATKVGGQVFGAFENGRMIAFLLAIPGIKPGGVSYLHSHMMGVLPEYRDRGLGRVLKLRQRDDAIARGIGLIEWTFDPLEIKNAYFNIDAWRSGTSPRGMPRGRSTMRSRGTKRKLASRCRSRSQPGEPRTRSGRGKLRSKSAISSSSISARGSRLSASNAVNPQQATC
jgi:GNAT superfamily N-acetyltransferase